MRILRSALVIATAMAACANAFGQTAPQAEPTQIAKPYYLRPIEVEVSGDVYIDIAANFDAVPAFLNYRGESYLVFTPLAFESLDALRKTNAARNTTVQFGDVIALAKVREIENFIAQLYDVDGLLGSAIQNSLTLAKAGNDLIQRRDLTAFGIPSGMSSLERYQFFQDQLNDPIAELDNRLERGGIIFETVRIRRSHIK